MRKTTYTESAHTATTMQPLANTESTNSGLPNRLMTAFEVAEYVGCHEETVRRAYWRGLLVSQGLDSSRRTNERVVRERRTLRMGRQRRRPREESLWPFGRSAGRKVVARAAPDRSALARPASRRRLPSPGGGRRHPDDSADARPCRHQADAAIPQHHGRGTAESDDGRVGTPPPAPGGRPIAPNRVTRTP